MTREKLEERLTALELQVNRLKAEVEKLRQPNDWRSSVGIFAPDDEMMKRINEAGRKYRAADRRRTMPKVRKKRKKVPS